MMSVVKGSMVAAVWMMLGGAGMAIAAETPPAALTAVPHTDVKLSDQFWSPRIERNRAVTIPHNFKMCEQTGRIANFARAGGLEKGPHQGAFFNDSDVYKVVEAASYSLAAHPDPQLDKYLDNLIAKFAAAQRPDGYLYTFYTPNGTLDKKFTNLKDHHELYCAGHLIEAAVAHHRATKKDNLLNIAIKLADHIDATFGENKRHDVDGHEEIELALFKLADETGQAKYRKLGEFFVRERGRGTGRKLYGAYYQDRKPTTQATEVEGHAVRQSYLLCAMTDMAAHGDAAQRPALDKLWKDLFERKMYITGGIGAKHEGEAFGEPYELPNESAYAETCAGIGNALWNHRMNLLTGDGKFADVVEQASYNGFLSGVSLSGDKFFYVNPLASSGKHHRLPWYDCACCPPNVARYMATVPGRAYAMTVDEATKTPTVYVNLYAAGEAKLAVGGTSLGIAQQTRYPWDGQVRLTITLPQPAVFALKLRIPQWCQGATVSINGAAMGELVNEKGYFTINGSWTTGDVVELNLPMPIKRMKADPRVKANWGRVALQRGPVVYCVEAVDNGGHVTHLSLPPDAELRVEEKPDLLGGVSVIKGKALARMKADAPAQPVDFTAIPYFAWDNREAGEMAVWLAEDASLATPIPMPTLASKSKPSASHTNETDTLEALNDGREPANSKDISMPRFTWWPQKGTSEWVQYQFAKPAEVSSAEAYFFDDGPQGGCRVPASWRVLYRAGDQWKPVEVTQSSAVRKDAFNQLAFKPIRTDALRLEAKLADGYSAGLLEWRVK
jgi:DUF1680 family protein